MRQDQTADEIEQAEKLPCFLHPRMSFLIFDFSHRRDPGDLTKARRETQRESNAKSCVLYRKQRTSIEGMLAPTQTLSTSIIVCVPSAAELGRNQCQKFELRDTKAFRHSCFFTPGALSQHQVEESLLSPHSFSLFSQQPLNPPRCYSKRTSEIEGKKQPHFTLPHSFFVL